MKYACIQSAQFRDGAKKIRTAYVGDVIETDQKVNEKCFLACDVMEVDFLTMSEDQLNEATFSFAAAATAVKENYDVDLKKTDKADIVKQIIDARFRQVD